MPLNILRVHHNKQDHWAMQLNDEVLKLDIPCDTTAKLIELGYEKIEAMGKKANEKLDINNLELLSPISQDAKVLCQGANYRQHMIDSGMNPDEKNFNMFFTKSSASIHRPQGKVIRPANVQLLDYEVELTLVMAKSTHTEVKVNDENLHEYVAGVCIGNDFSARDIQIPQMQFHKGKSYRTFCPLGPVLCLLSKDELQYLHKLELELKVNGQVRQQDSSRNLVHKPAATITEFSTITNFNAGDVIMTGTPSGCALALPPPILTKIVGLLPDNKKWKIFIKKQLARPQYLKPGDEVISTIKSKDGVIDLGSQNHSVISAGSL